MAKKLGKYVALATVLSASVGVVLALKKHAEDHYCSAQEDPDFDTDDFDENVFDVDGEFAADRSYVTLAKDTQSQTEEEPAEETETTTDVVKELKDVDSLDDGDFLEAEVTDELNSEA